MRARRSCLSVPGSSPRMLTKAASLPADEVMLDLEDSVAPSAKVAARAAVVHALRDNSWHHKTASVRINSVASQWAGFDLLQVVCQAGEHLDCVVLPKVEHAHEVMFVDHWLRMIESDRKLDRPIGIEAQIETALGLVNINEIANSSPRLEALVFGPADMSASLGIPTVSVGAPLEGYPGDHWHWALETILVAARAAGLQAVDGPYLAIDDLDGFKEMAKRSNALGYDGKWALHPTQIEVVNEVFTPPRDIYERAEAVLDAYHLSIENDERGAVMFGDEMIDEASRKMAARLAERGRAAGLKSSRDEPEREHG
ncbi:MAG: CoA ester lyase [Actinobacteria bacterium]|nr:CoA ester lyase [Actinomycetota bacterium]